MTQVSKVRIAEGKRPVIIDQEFVISGIRQFLPANLSEGGGRRHDILQFYAKDGGLRTVETRDLML